MLKRLKSTDVERNRGLLSLFKFGDLILQTFTKFHAVKSFYKLITKPSLMKNCEILFKHLVYNVKYYLPVVSADL